MRSLRKLITVILVIAMALTSVGVVAFAETTFSDISDQKVVDAVNKLVAYKIITGYEDGTFRPDNQITRAEFAAIVTRMKGVADNLPSDSVTGFSDLDNDGSRAWARPYVKAAVDLKIINGFEDGTFRAGEPVTYEQAVKMLVCAVGYEVVANSEYNKAIMLNPNATWSAGFIAAANKHGITKGVITAMISEPASRGTVAVLTSNALEVPELTTDSQGNLVKPEDGKGETESKMTTITGTVTGTYYTALDDSDSGLQEDEIYIDATDDDDDGTYTLADSVLNSLDLDEYIGRKVTAYYDNLEGEVTSIKLSNTSSTIIEESSIESISGKQIKYRTSNGRTQSEDLTDRTFIVNGKYVDSYDLNTFKNGSIELFTGGGYKIAKVKSYEIFVVQRFDKENEKIYRKYVGTTNNVYEFPTRSSDKPLIYVKSSGGSAYNLTQFSSLSLSEYDVINYLESPQGTSGDPLRRMYVTKGSKSGKVTATLDGEREVELGEETLYLTQQYFNYTPSGSDDQKAPFELSDTYTYYLDYTGQIAAVKYSASASTGSWSYGYLIEIDDRENQVGILQSGGTYKAFDLKDSVKVDGAKTKASSVFDLLKTAASEIVANKDSAPEAVLTKTNGYAQPIRYSVSGGKIDSFDTVIDNPDEEGTNDNFTYDGKLGSSAGSTTTTKVTVDGKTYAVNSSTIVIYVPKDRTDDGSYAVMKASSAFAVTKDRYTEVFAVDSASSNNLAKVVLVYGVNPTLNFIGSTPFMLVTKVRSDGTTETFEGYVNGAETTSSVTVSDDNFESTIEGNSNTVSSGDVQVGDIIRYIKDNSGNIIAIEMIYDANGSGKLAKAGDKEYLSNGEGTGSDFVAHIGEITAKDSTDNTIEISGSKAKTYKNSSTKYFKLASNGDVNTSVLEDIVLSGEEGASQVVLISRSMSEGASATIVYIVK